MKETDIDVLAASYDICQLIDALGLGDEEVIDLLYPVINAHRSNFPELQTQPVYEEDQ